MLTLKTRFILMGLLLLASVGFGATGEYQQTRDGKTTVWNGTPKPGETASWAGARDKAGYATGFGTITWYNEEGKVYAIYYGNMVNGKLEGPVNVHMGRRTAHSYFADGARVTAWARGPAPSKMNVPEDLVAKRRKAETEQPKPREERAEAKKEKPEKRPETAEIVRPIEHATPKPEQKEPQITETVERPREEAPEETPQPSTAIAEMPSPPTPEPTQSASSFSEPPKIAESQEPPKPIETPQVPTPEPLAEEKPKVAEQPATTEPTARSGIDNSLSALTGPPSSLRSRSTEESSSPSRSATTSRSTSSGARGVAQLSEDEAIGLADVEARARGYDLNEYQRPKTDYSAVKDKWSLFYNLKDPKAAGGDLQPFSVTVEDKTRKVEIRRNY